MLCLTAQIGGEFTVTPKISLDANASTTGGSANGATTMTIDTIPSTEWAVGARLSPRVGTWLHIGYGYQTMPRTADWEGGVTYGAYGGISETSIALSQEF